MDADAAIDEGFAAEEAEGIAAEDVRGAADEGLGGLRGAGHGAAAAPDYYVIAIGGPERLDYLSLKKDPSQ
ncbi:MAG: hypothetical protein QOJ98_2573 [Acidobacteriota bacterium]|nr:hypothetical protein [Acidobacteriota bacterium]